MKRYFMSDNVNIDRMITSESSHAAAIAAFYDYYGYEPDIVKVIDDLGGTLEVIRE